VDDGEFVAVTYGEFQAWYNYGELRLRRDRLVPLSGGNDGLPDPGNPHVNSLIERSPQLSLEDEEGILIIQVGATHYDVGNDPHTLLLPIDCVKHVIPLTDRAQRILESRMQGIKLERPYLEAPVGRAWFKMGVRRAWRGGDALVGLLFEDGLSCIGDPLRQAVEEGIWKIEPRDDEPGRGPSERDAGKTWVPKAFAFARPAPYNKGGGEMDYLRDAHAVLSDCQKPKKTDVAPSGQPIQGQPDRPFGLLEKVGSDLAKEFKATGRLVEIVASEHFAQAAKATQFGFENAVPAELATLVLFLRWKDLFHKQRDQVEVEGLATEIPGFVSAVGFDETVAAVWLLGCFAGYERIAPAVYAADPDPDRFRWYSGPRSEIKKEKRPKSKETSETAAPTSDNSLESEQQTEAESAGDEAAVSETGAPQEGGGAKTKEQGKSGTRGSRRNTSNEQSRGNQSEPPVNAQSSEGDSGSRSEDNPST
jgi:hypothetical protein